MAKRPEENNVRALLAEPGRQTGARLAQVPEPRLEYGDLLVEALEIGICGTDLEIVEGRYGIAPDHENYLILGHESLGRVLEAPKDSGFTPGELVVGIVRRPDPEPCGACAVGDGTCV
jgi:glucose 1-dehydrogenase